MTRVVEQTLAILGRVVENGKGNDGEFGKKSEAGSRKDKNTKIQYLDGWSCERTSSIAVEREQSG